MKICYIYSLMEHIENIKPKEKGFTPVKDYAILNNITVQAVYERIKKNTIEVKKIGSYTLVRDI